MAESVGQIGLDLVVNQNQFKQQMSGIQGLAKKAGKVLAAAFAVKKIWDFGAACIKLGSDLQEVQNVVDVTFPQMSKQVDEFAQNAATSFGLSETMAKKFTGTFGAMAKAFGFGEQQAFEMATALTGLSGDVASFYNISQDEAYTKLKSVFTGETETLKDLGIVMTQNALDSYALANGYGKVTAKMSEAEKVALRYKFVTDQLSLASGDFIRTSDGWANQVRVLQLQFDSLRATIGQGLINVLTPVIKVINMIIGKLMSLANAFKAFTEMITGKKSGGGAAVAAAGMEDVAGAADNAAEAVDGVGGAAKKAGKAGKEAKAGLSGIDKLNVINTNGGGSGGGSGSGSGGYAADQFDMGEIDTSMDEVDQKYQGLIDKCKELAGLFKKGFQLGLGNTTSRLKTIENGLKKIKKNLKEIFTAPEVKKAASDWADTVAYNMGVVTGSMASMGLTTGANLIGGLSQYLEGAKDRIKQYFVDMFNITGQTSTIIANFYAAYAEIFSALAGENGRAFTENLIGIFSEFFMGMTELCAKLGRDILDALLTPITKNADKFKKAFDDLLGVASQVMGDIKDVIADTFEKVNQVYDDHIAPMFQAFRDGLTDIYGTALEAFNTHILPALQTVADKITEFKDSHLQPLIDKFLEFGGKVADTVTIIWDNALKPFFEWAIKTFAPLVGAAIEGLGTFFEGWFQTVSEVASNVLDALNGVLEFLHGVFQGDTQKALNGLKEIFRGVFNGIITIVESAVNRIVRGLNGISFDIPDWSPIAGGEHFGFDLKEVELRRIEPPRLAQGGFVRANTPQLAMIGDNRHQGEVVAPEGKLQELLNQAVKAGGMGSVETMEIIMLLRDMTGLLKVISRKNPERQLTQGELFEAVRNENDAYILQHGSSAFV